MQTIHSKLTKQLLFYTAVIITIVAIAGYFITILDAQTLTSPNSQLIVNIIKFAIIFAVGTSILLSILAFVKIVEKSKEELKEQLKEATKD